MKNPVLLLFEIYVLVGLSNCNLQRIHISPLHLYLSLCFLLGKKSTALCWPKTIADFVYVPDFSLMNNIEKWRHNSQNFPRDFTTFQGYAAVINWNMYQNLENTYMDSIPSCLFWVTIVFSKYESQQEKFKINYFNDSKHCIFTWIGNYNRDFHSKPIHTCVDAILSSLSWYGDRSKSHFSPINALYKVLAIWRKHGIKNVMLPLWNVIPPMLLLH